MDDGLDTRNLRFVTAGGVRTRCYDAGAGDVVLLIHGGAFGSLYSLDSWSLNLDVLAHTFRVVAFDKLGQGHTDNPPESPAYRFRSLVTHTCALLDELGIEQAHLVGHSMGAFLAILVAMERPSLARSLVLVDSNTAAPDDPRYPRGVFYERLERTAPPGATLFELVRREPEAQSFSTAHVTEDFTHRLLEIAYSDRHREAAAVFRDVRDEFKADLDILRRETIARVEAVGLGAPTLVVWGKNDPSAPVELAYLLFERVQARTAGAELHVFDKAGHYVFREQPRGFESLLVAFLRRQPGP